MNQYTQFYYDFNTGEFPENKDFIHITDNYFDYLIDAGFNKKDLYKLNRLGLKKPSLFLIN